MAMEIKLTQGKVAIVDDEDYEWLMGYKWRVKERHNNWYAYGIVDGRDTMMHRYIMSAEKGVFVDHKSGDGLDNRRSNLRLCTNTQNQQNQHRVRGVSKYKGVSWNVKIGKWQVRIRINGKQLYVGYYDSEVEGAMAYDAMAIKLFGPFACTNAQLITQS